MSTGIVLQTHRFESDRRLPFSRFWQRLNVDAKQVARETMNTLCCLTERDWAREPSWPFFLPGEQDELTKQKDFTALLVNFGLIIATRGNTTAEQKLIDIMERNYQFAETVLSSLYGKGKESFLLERKRSGKLIELNLFKANLGLHDEIICSLYDESDERRLKNAYAIPCLTMQELEEREQFFSRLERYQVLADGLGIRQMFNHFEFTRDDDYYQTVKFRVYLKQLDYLKARVQRPSQALAVIHGGALRAVVSSLLTRLLIVICNEFDPAELGFKAIPKQGWVEYLFLAEEWIRERVARTKKELARTVLNNDQIRKATSAQYLESLNLMSHQFRGIREDAMRALYEGYVGLFISMFTLTEKQFGDLMALFLYENDKVQAALPVVAELVKAVLTAPDFEQVHLVKQVDVTGELFAAMGQDFMGFVEDLKKDVLAVEEFMAREININKVRAFWRERLIVEGEEVATPGHLKKDENALRAGDRFLPVSDICHLKKLGDVLHHIRNFDSWPPSDQQRLVEQFAWQRFLEFGSGEEVMELLKIMMHRAGELSAGETAIVTQSQRRDYWAEVSSLLDWSRGEVRIQPLVKSWYLVSQVFASAQNQQATRDYLLAAGRKIPLIKRRFNQTQFPAPSKDDEFKSFAIWQAEHALAVLLLNRLRVEEFDWCEKSSAIIAEWYMYAEPTVLYPFVIEMTPPKKTAAWLIKHTPSRNYCPPQEVLLSKWAEVLWELDWLGKTKPVTFDAMSFVSLEGQQWYSETVKRSPKNASLAKAYWLEKKRSK